MGSPVTITPDVQGGPSPVTITPDAPKQDSSAQPSGFWDTLQREGKALTGTIAGMPAAVYHAFSEPPTAEEKEKFGGEDQVSGAKRVGLGIHRLAVAPVETAIDWYSDAAKGKNPQAYEDALSVAPEAVGSAAGNVLAAKGAESLAEAPGAIKSAANTARSVAGSETAGKLAASAKVLGASAEELPVVGKFIKAGKKLGQLQDIWNPADATKENVPYAGEEAPGQAQAQPAAAQPAARTVTTDPATGRPEFSDVLAQKTQQPNHEAGTYFGARAQDFPGQAPARNYPAQQNQGVSVPGETNAQSAARTIVTDPETGRPEFSDVLAQKGEAKPAAATPAKPAPTLDDLEKAINDALGGKALDKNTPIRNQSVAGTKPALPEGFTPVDSSVLRGYKYDPAAKEFTAITNSGQEYTHGEVTPDQVAAFEGANSQGKAWTTAIRNNNPLIRKNGMAVKPATMASESGEIMPKSRAGMNEPETEQYTQDLTDLLQQSLAKAKKQ